MQAAFSPSLSRDQLLPPENNSVARGFAFALVAHIALAAGLAFSVNWRMHEPETLQAELWATVPQAAAPREVQPPPIETPQPKTVDKPALPRPDVHAQRDAQIAVERAKIQRKLDAERLAAEAELAKAAKRRQEQEAAALAATQKNKQLEAQKKQEQRDAAKLDAMRQENIKRMQQSMAGIAGASGGPTATGAAKQSAGPSASYGGRIKARIKPNIIFNEAYTGNPVAEIEVRTAADGIIIGSRLVKASGNHAWDDAVLRAVERTGELPRDVDGTIPKTMILIFSPRD